MKMDAEFSPCRRYRYALWRIWDGSKPHALMILLNPSIADHKIDSKTSKRCIEFAKSWGYGGLCIGNLFAYRSQDKTMIRKVQDPIGPENDEWLIKLSAAAGVVVAGWGNDGSYMNRARQVCSLVKNIYCLRTTQKGQAQHPLYLLKGLEPIPYDGITFYSRSQAKLENEKDYLPLRNKMNFEKAWQYLQKHQPLSLPTFKGETQFMVYVSDSSIRYESSTDQPRPQTKENFRKYFDMWVKHGIHYKYLFLNLTKNSKAARSRYYLAILEHLAKIPGLK